jgi:hypothetical protein
LTCACPCPCLWASETASGGDRGSSPCLGPVRLAIETGVGHGPCRAGPVVRVNGDEAVNESGEASGAAARQADV